MKYRRFTNLSCSLVVFLLCLSGVSKANPLIANSLVKEGQTLIAEGDYREAAHELARALLLEIDHVDARTALLKLKNVPTLPEEIQVQIREYSQLYALLQTQQTDIDDLLARRSDLTDALLSRGVPEARIQERLYYWEELAYKNKNRAQDQMQQDLAFERDALNLLNGYMRIEKEKKFNKISYLEQQYDDLANLKYALASEGIGQEPRTMERVHTEKFYTTKGEPKYKTGTTPVLRFENFQDMKNHMARQEGRIERLSEQIVDLSLRISEKDMQMGRAEDVAEPSFPYADVDSKEWQSRFELSERIIKRKR